MHEKQMGNDDGAIGLIGAAQWYLGKGEGKDAKEVTMWYHVV